MNTQRFNFRKFMRGISSSRMVKRKATPRFRARKSFSSSGGGVFKKANNQVAGGGYGATRGRFGQ